MKVKLKISKTEQVQFNGTYVTNGKWGARADLVQLSDKTLQGLVDTGVKFARTADGKVLNVGEEARVITQEQWDRLIPATATRIRLARTPILLQGEAGTLRAYIADPDADGRIVWIDIRYEPVCDLGEIEAQADEPQKRAIAIVQENADDREIVAVVMPVVLEPAKIEEISKVGRALYKGAE